MKHPVFVLKLSQGYAKGKST